MARHYFGTDGIRGVVGQDPITPDFFIRLGFAIGSILVKNNRCLLYTSDAADE